MILESLLGEEMRRYVAAEADRQVPEADRDAFINDVFEDLELIDESRLVGLGVTPKQFGEWLVSRRGK